MGVDTTIPNLISSMWDFLVLGLTPMQRWAATGKLSPTNKSEDFDMNGLLIAVLVLVLLVLILCWVSARRKGRGHVVQREFFTESANRRGLGTRERQILLAIVVRSGLGQSEDIFTVVDAFDHGAAKLQEECGQTRTADENEKLRVEIAALRSKLGFELSRSQGGPAADKRPSSRDILVGQIVDLTRRQRDSSSIQVEVVRNDDIELAVELPQELEIRDGEGWSVRYDFGTALWEFDTATVRCEGKRLVLNHSNRVRFLNRRRFPRLSVHVPAWVAPLPAANERHPLEPPVFVPGAVVEMAGPGLRIEVPIQVSVGDRLLVMFQMESDSVPSGHPQDGRTSAHTVSAIGRAQYIKGMPDGVSIAMELNGLDEADVDELVRYAYAAQVPPNMDPAGGPNDVAGMASPAAAKGGVA